MILGTKFQLKLTIFVFLTKFAQKGCFRSKIKQRNTIIRITLGTKFQVKLSVFIFWTKFAHTIIPITLGTKFQVKLSIWIFWTKFALKGYLRSKTQKRNITTEFCIFQLDYILNCSLNRQFWFFGPNLPKVSIADPKQKNRTFACVHGRYLVY